MLTTRLAGMRVAAVRGPGHGRVERLEMFDELEEWRLILGHYCLATAVKDPAGLLDTSAFPFPADPEVD